MALELTGSIDITTGAAFTDQDGRYSGSFSGSFVGDGSGLTGVSVSGESDFPYTGSAIISGSLEVEGSVTIISGSFIGQGSGLTEVNPFPYEGQADIIGALKVDGVGEFNYLSSSNGAWSTGGNLNYGRTGIGGTGTQNAALGFGGFGLPSIPSPYFTAATEEYNGTIWSAGGNLNTVRRDIGGAGTQNSGLAFGGTLSDSVTRTLCTEEYNGSSWSVGGTLNRCSKSKVGAGTQNAALAFGGTCYYSAPSPVLVFEDCTEEYNGQSWAVGVSLLNPREFLTATGTQNAGLAFSGSPTSTYYCTEEYNGSSWSQGGAFPSVKFSVGGAGTQNAALAFGGWTPSTYFNTAEKYNGFTWSSSENLSVGRGCLGAAGQQNTALAFGGRSSTAYACDTEEYNADACYRKHFYTQQNTVYADQLYVSGSSTVEAVFNLANRTDTPSPLTAGTLWQSGSAGAGCLYFTPDGSSICKISFA